jgi:hypothetical protein
MKTLVLLASAAVLHCANTPRLSILTVGQSNMAYARQPLIDLNTGATIEGTTEENKLATVPTVLANSLTDSGYSVTIHSTAIGGTPLKYWTDGEGHKFFENLSGLDAVVIWHGETDALGFHGDALAPQEYEEKFLGLIKELRAKGNSVKIIAVSLEKFYPLTGEIFDGGCACPEKGEPARWSEFRAMQKRLFKAQGVKEINAQEFTNGEIHPMYAYETVATKMAEALTQAVR